MKKKLTLRKKFTLLLDDIIALIWRSYPYTEQAKENTAFLYNLLGYGASVTAVTYDVTVAEAAVVGVKTPYFYILYGGVFFVFNAINFSQYHLAKNHDLNLTEYAEMHRRDLALACTTHAKTVTNIARETIELTVMESLATLTALNIEAKDDPDSVIATFSGFFAFNLLHTILLHYYKDHPEKESGLHKAFNRYFANGLIAAGLSQAFFNNWLYDGPGNIEDAQSVAIGSIAAGFGLNFISAAIETVMKRCAGYKSKDFDSFHLWMLRGSEILSLTVFFVIFAMNFTCNQIDCNNPNYDTPLTVLFVIYNIIGLSSGIFTSIHTEENKPHRAAPSFDDLLTSITINTAEKNLLDPDNDNDAPRNYGAIQNV